MEITLSVWAIPVILTILIVLLSIYKYRDNDLRKGNDVFGLGEMFSAIASGAIITVGTLLVWLIFFVIMYFTK